VDNIIKIDTKLGKRVQKRALQILLEISDIKIEYLTPENILKLSEKIKIFTDKYNCVIKSWVKDGIGFALCYNSVIYIKEDFNSWGSITAPTEAEAILASLLWLADRGFFNEEEIKKIRKEIL